MGRTMLLSILLVALVFAGKAFFSEPPSFVDESPHAFLDEDRTFLGVERCKTCHRKPEQGEQFRLWQEGPHAKAYNTLASDEAKAIAAERGIDDPQKAGECLKCHTTAYGVDAQFLGPKFTFEEGVGCESCHGAGGDYYKKKTKEAIKAGEIDPASVGLLEPNEEVCRTCHNEESPTYKEFNFEERVKSVNHPTPDSTQAEGQ